MVNVTGGFREKVKEITGGRGADVIYDPVGGDVFDESVRCIAFDGRHPGDRLHLRPPAGAVSVNIALIKGFSVMGVRAGEYGRPVPGEGPRERTRRCGGWPTRASSGPRACRAAAGALARGVRAAGRAQGGGQGGDPAGSIAANTCPLRVASRPSSPTGGRGAARDVLRPLLGADERRSRQVGASSGNPWFDSC